MIQKINRPPVRRHDVPSKRHAFVKLLRELRAQFREHDAVVRRCACYGELDQRDEIVTTIQAHPCNAATAAAAGFKVITLPLEEDGYPSVAALEAAVGEALSRSAPAVFDLASVKL